MPHAFLSAVLCSLYIAVATESGVTSASQAVAVPPAAAQKDDYPKPLMLLQRTITETMLASPAGHPHRIMVSAPQGGEPKGGCPVIYVLDGDGWMGAAVEIAKMREYEKLDPAIIVGIGYPSHSFFDAIGRSYDFTPPNSADPDFEGIPLGGANDFLDFLNTTLKSWIGAHYHADPQRQVLFGHSMGGLFALYALYKAPESFAVYIAGSPDLPFSNHILRNLEPAFETNPAYRKARVLVTVGELEGGESPALMDDYRRYYTAHPETHLGETVEQVMTETFGGKEKNYDKIADTRALAARLANGGVHATFVEFLGEEHMSAAISALNRGIPFALRSGQEFGPSTR